jgi:long-chain fatty acid transport protein
MKSIALSSLSGRSLAVVALMVVGAPAAYGAGFQLNEHAAAATGRMSAVVATIDDASAVFYNPAGLANIDGTSAMGGLALIGPRAEYKGPGLDSTRPAGVSTVDQANGLAFQPLPHAYVSRALSSKAFVGFGVYAPYGLIIDWSNNGTPGPNTTGPKAENFVGRTVAQEIDLKTVFITPAIALKLSDQVQVAVSVSLVPASVYLRRVLGANDNGQVLFPAAQYGSEGIVELSGSAFGVGANAGIQVSLIDHLKLGFVFRSAVGLNFSGKAAFNIPSTAPASIRANFPDGDINADLTLPHSFGLGVGWVQGPLTVELTGNLTLWQSYDKLEVDFASMKPQPALISNYNWNAAPTIRLGGEYRLPDLLTLRLGVGYDWTPVPDSTIDPTLPDNNRFLISAGVGGKIGPVYLDAAYMAVILGDRHIPAGTSVNFPVEATWVGQIDHVIAFSAGIHL